ncbi:DUF948 domain-containing protein [Oceanobacillus luteolus]|uniref:DUF948 domain-containing protein n=1 Tax=Oceanobacillus luteolus TaxID=1274358 RepID=A0ABW4HV44_9BACI|nr:DUF948 domain-containing protein [Oceanobacillus luteolus]
MEIMLYIAIIIAVIALVVLTVYTINTLKVTKDFLNETKTTLQGLETQVKGITTETTQLLNKTNRLADDVELKSRKMDGLLDGAKGIGETMKEFDRSLNQLSNSIARASSEDREKTNEAVKWGASILEFVMKRNKQK